MSQVLLRAVGLVRKVSVALTLLAVTALSCALLALPLFSLPGYELSAALALVQGLFGAISGIAAARQEKRLIRGVDPRPKGAIRFDGALSSVLYAWGAAVVLNLVVVAIPFIAAVIRSALSTQCDPFAALGFFPVLTVPSALMSASAGVLCAFLSRRVIGAALWYVLFVLVSAVATAGPLIWGPQVYVFNHFAGHLPGPLYDEALSVTAALGWFRLETLLWTVLLLALTSLMVNMRDGTLTRPHLRVGSLALLGALGFAIVMLEQRGPSQGTRMSHAALASKLGGHRTSDHFELFYPRGKPKDEVERTVRDLEFRHAQLSEFLGAPSKERVRVYWYRSAAEKQALVGASGTQFAKPWLREIHVNDAAFPHPSLKHELAHVLAAPFGAPPFSVTARGLGLVPNAGIIEGLAVAADNPVDDLTLHAWSAAMRKHQMLPDVRRLVSAGGFYTQAASRAYTAAGSFLKWLKETHGAEKLRTLYRAGDFQLAYGRSLDDLALEWEKFLDAVPLDEDAVNQAFARFRQGSIFQRSCAREVAKLSAEAAEVLPSDPDAAAEKLERCASLQPDEPSFNLGRAQALVKSGRYDDAAEVLKTLGAKVREQPSALADVEMALADLEVKRARPDAAKPHLQKIVELKVAPAMDRTARVKLSALSSPAEVASALWAYFQEGRDDLKLLLLREALSQAPKHAEVNYLLGRRLTQGNAPALALPYLRAALDAGLSDSVRKEALRLLVEAQFLAADCDGVRTTVGQLPDYGEAFKARAQEWAQRCAFEQQTFGAPLAAK